MSLKTAKAPVSSALPPVATGEADKPLTFTNKHARPLFDPPIVRRAVVDAFRKLNPRAMVKNPVMFVVEVGSAFTTLLFIHAITTGQGEASPGFILGVSVWLWITVLFANFAEAMAEGR